MSKNKQNEIGPESIALLSLKKQFYEFWQDKGFNYEENPSCIPKKTRNKSNFITCNAAEFPNEYLGINREKRSNHRIVRLQSVIRSSGNRKSGISKKHLTGFDMLGLFDFQCANPRVIFSELMDFFIEDLSIKNLSINVATDSILYETVLEIQNKFPDLKLYIKDKDELTWNRIDELYGERIEVNWNDGVDMWELWSISYIDNRIFDSGGSLERVLAAKLNIKSVFDVGELMELKTKLRKKINIDSENVLDFIVDQVRAINKIEFDKISTNGNSGRNIFLRILYEKLLSVLISFNVENIQDIFLLCNLKNIEEINLFSGKIDRAHKFFIKNKQIFDGTSIRELLSERFYNEHIKSLNILKYPYLLLHLLNMNDIEIDSDFGELENKTSVLLSKLPLIYLDIINIQKRNMIIEKIRSDFKNLDDVVSLILVGSAARKIEDAKDIDLIAITRPQSPNNQFIDSIRSYEGVSDTSLRFNVSGVEVGILPLDINQFRQKIYNVINEHNFEPLYKEWAVGAEVPEGFVGDIYSAKSLIPSETGDVEEIINEVISSADKLFQFIELQTKTDLILRFKQMDRQIELGEEGYLGLQIVISQINFLLIRLIFARQKKFFYGVKRVDRKILMNEQMLFQILESLEKKDYEQAKILISQI